MTLLALASVVALQTSSLPLQGPLLEGRTLAFASQDLPPPPPMPLPPPPLPAPAPPVEYEDNGPWVPSLALILPLMIGGGVIAIVGIPVTLYGLISALVGCDGCNADMVLIEGIGDIVLGTMLFFIGNHYRGVRNAVLSGRVSLSYDPHSRAVAALIRF